MEAILDPLRLYIKSRYSFIGIKAVVVTCYLENWRVFYLKYL